MKKYVALIITFIMFSGCAPLVHIPVQSAVYSFNLSAFSEKEFYFYEDCLDGKYILLSDIALEVYAEGNKNGNSYGSWNFKPIDTDEVLKMMYDEAIKYGANAVMNFSFEIVCKKVKYMGRIIEIPGLKVHGNAIFEQKI